MLIDDVANQMITKANTLARKHDYRPKLAVYMSQSFHYECTMEIRGEVSGVAMTFLNDNKVLIYPVHRVIGDHPSFRIVEV
jgi:hypothetical protein